jgi:hypothetical protein
MSARFRGTSMARRPGDAAAAKAAASRKHDLSVASGIGWFGTSMSIGDRIADGGVS